MLLNKEADRTLLHSPLYICITKRKRTYLRWKQNDSKCYWI